MRNQVLQTYADKLPDPLPLSQQREFKQIKNMVIQEAMRMGGQQTQQPTRDAPDDHVSVDVASSAPTEIPVAAVSAAARLLRELSKLFDDQQQKQAVHADQH